MIIRLLICVLSIFVVTLVGCSRNYPEAEVTIKIVDEDGGPINAVNVGITLELPKGNGQISYISKEGTTGADGIFRASGNTMSNIAYGAEKQGYYKSSGEYHFVTSANGRWQPWNPEFTLVLRKIGNPAPMYACQLRTLTLPEMNKRIGFDLIEYDWVSPYGNGKHADFIFRIDGKYKNEYEYDNTLTLTFANKLDGIQLITEDRKFGSQFKLPRTAPETGYQNKLIRSESRVPGQPYKSDSKEDNNYIFRIRSEEKNGKLIRAMYGKIQGDINFGVDKMTHKASITFTPYLNPDYSRNLEFDPNKNLFNNLQSFEHVGL
jgi:hypothetical protein